VTLTEPGQPGLLPGAILKEWQERRFQLRIVVIGLLVAAYFWIAFYCMEVLRTSMVFSHFAYIPVVLSGIWWGKKGIWTAIVLASIHIILRWSLPEKNWIMEDAARIGFFIVVAFLVGLLSDRAREWQKVMASSEEKYRVLVGKSLTGVLVYRNSGILFANEQFAQMMECKPEELIGKTIWELIYEEDHPLVRSLLMKREEQGVRDLHYECRLKTKTGKIIWVEIASSPVSFEDGEAVLVSTYDNTQRKESENKQLELAELARKQEEQLIHSTRLAELGEMSAAVAHELNQPLTGIRNYARNAFYMLDKSSGSSEDVKNNLRLISEQVDRASKIINQMRELTRHSERQFVLVDVNGLLRESIEFLRPQLRLSGVEIVLNLTEKLPEILGDRVRLEQVLLNLITNAKQAMEEVEKRRLCVATRMESEAAKYIVIEITDTGVGFDDKVARKLFAPFFTTKRPGEGTGLGLSISLSIINDHNGTIKATGKPGEGATFTIRLPAEQKETVTEASEK